MFRTDLPLPRRVVRRGDLSISDGGTFVFRQDPSEARAEVDVEWLSAHRARGVRLVGVTSEDLEWIEVEVDGESSRISLYDPESLRALIRGESNEVWIDSTGLDFASWAPLVQAAVQADVLLQVIYAEPDEYRSSARPVERIRFDLSKRTRGPGPVPGFNHLTLPERSDSIFIPFMGFEGERLQRIIGDLEYEDRRTFPLLGMPGFQLAYPFHALEANASLLNRAPMHRNVRLARASCPFEAYLAVEQLKNDEGVSNVVIAPIGTKPHSLGAALYSILNREHTTLVYDHPVRAEGRTIGSRKMHVFDVTAFIRLVASGRNEGR